MYSFGVETSISMGMFGYPFHFLGIVINLLFLGISFFFSRCVTKNPTISNLLSTLPQIMFLITCHFTGLVNLKCWASNPPGEGSGNAGVTPFLFIEGQYNNFFQDCVFPGGYFRPFDFNYFLIMFTVVRFSRHFVDFIFLITYMMIDYFSFFIELFDCLLEITTSILIYFFLETIMFFVNQYRHFHFSLFRPLFLSSVFVLFFKIEPFSCDSSSQSNLFLVISLFYLLLPIFIFVGK